MALRHKHPATASHSLRVALGCSTWALYKRLDEDTRDAVEVAALLHDIGKIGVADSVLDGSQAAARTGDWPLPALREQFEAGVSILACCCSCSRVLEAVRHAGSRFDGHGGGGAAILGDRLPIEARMIAIVDAFDEMTADPTNGSVSSREMALKKLQEGAGSLFDPILVKQFIELMSQQHDALNQRVAVRWLNELGKRQSELPWTAQRPNPASRGRRIEYVAVFVAPANGRVRCAAACVNPNAGGAITLPRVRGPVRTGDR
jgi:response regulator RpfG family c-di-GMP phosphodiesterase